jgi:hypothetical protein
MNTAGVYNQFYMQPGLGHTVDFNMMFDGATLRQHEIAFLAEYLAPEPSSLATAAMGAIALALVARRLHDKQSSRGISHRGRRARRDSKNR